MRNFQSVQSAYRKFHSCEAALLHVQNDIFVSLDASRSTALLLLDLLAAFDTIDHSILINRLKNWFGVSSTAFNLYLDSSVVDLKFLLLQMLNHNLIY